MDGSVLEKNCLLRSCGWLSLLNLIGALKLSLLQKVSPRTWDPWFAWFVLWSFFLLTLLCISINLPYRHAWNTVVVSEMLPQLGIVGNLLILLLVQLVLLPFSQRKSTRYSDRLHHFSVTLSTKRFVSTISFFAQIHWGILCLAHKMLCFDLSSKCF